MDHNHKTWLWRKKSTERMIVSSDKVNLSTMRNAEEIQTLLTAKAELEKDLKSSNDKLSSYLSECNTKDGTIKKHVKMAEEAMAGWENAEAIAATLKQELDAVLQQRAAGEERLTHLEGALKECMQQLHFVREEQERRVHDAVIKASTEFERSEKILEDKLAETSKRNEKLVAENTHLSKALLAKEKSIEDLIQQKAQVETDLNAMMSSLESTEKENVSLKYEVRVLEKELEIRNEEREFNRRTADASHKQHLESVKKIAKLESECQRLRLLVRKRLPGPAALAKMRSEVDVLGRDSVEMRRRRTKSSVNGFTADFTVDPSLDTYNKQVNFLTEQLYAVEEENNSLKEALDKKANELQVSRSMYARTASKLSQVESHLDELSKGQTSIDPSRRGRSGFAPCELSHASMSDVGSDDKISCAESWACALISELEHFKHGKQRGSPSGKTVGASDISLMDDFAEMERLAIVSVHKQTGSPHVSCDDATVSPFVAGINGYVSEVTGTEIIPVSEISSGASNPEIKSENSLIGKAPVWLDNILKVVLEQACTTQRKPYEILENVRVALADISQEHPAESLNSKESAKENDASNSANVGGHISWKPTNKHLLINSSCGINDDDALLTDGKSRHMQTDLGKSILKIIELVEGITLPRYGALDNSQRKGGHLFPYKNTETSSDYTVRVFQWKASDLGAVLQKFVHACYDLLNGKSDVNSFAQELTSALDWVMNHCFSLQDVSSMKDAIKKHLDLDETRSENEAEVGLISQSEVKKMCLNYEQSSYLPMVSDATGLRKSLGKDEFQHVTIEENMKLNDDLINIKSAKNDLQGRLQSALDRSESLMNQFQESEQTAAHLRAEVDTPKMSKAVAENQMSVKHLHAQFPVAKAELNEAHQKFSSFEMELENKNSRCEELEATCLELQLRHESVTKNTIPELEEQKQLRSDWEITAASEKLAECQETILNLGKQLKALATPCDTALLDKVISTSTETTDASIATTATSTTPATPRKLMNQRSSLLDQMLAEDNAKTKDSDSKSPKMKRSDYDSSVLVPNEVIEPLEKILFLNGSKHQDGNVATSSLAIVPSKKQGGASLWRKLLWRKKKSNIRRPPLPFTP